MARNTQVSLKFSSDFLFNSLHIYFFNQTKMLNWMTSKIFSSSKFLWLHDWPYDKMSSYLNLLSKQEWTL